MISLALLTAFAFFIPFGTGFYVGREIGIERERLRTVRIFDIAFNMVSSGALKKVYRRITGEYANDDELRTALIRECEYRAKEREAQRRFG